MHYYDRLAAGYNELHEEEQLKKLQVLLKHVTFRGKILDVGAGTCLVARHLDKNIQCISVDSSKEMLAKGVGERHVAKAESLPFSNGIFDGVISLTALHHADFQQALAEIKRVARPGATIAISFLKKSPKLTRFATALHAFFSSIKQYDAHQDILFVMRT